MGTERSAEVVRASRVCNERGGRASYRLLCAQIVSLRSGLEALCGGQLFAAGVENLFT
jgi:hypothetical protein